MANSPSPSPPNSRPSLDSKPESKSDSKSDSKVPTQALLNPVAKRWQKTLSSHPTAQLATLGAGCFWGVQHLLRAVPGVLGTCTGYAGGKLIDPRYQQVKTGQTGHAEVVQILFDPKVLSFSNLLTYFWRLHDPTDVDRQGVDVGTQYRSVIFCHNEEQKQQAEVSKAELVGRNIFSGKNVATLIQDLPHFYPAEDYHQDYFANNGGEVCHFYRDY